jgi:hypothetical protein
METEKGKEKVEIPTFKLVPTTVAWISPQRQTRAPRSKGLQGSGGPPGHRAGTMAASDGRAALESHMGSFSWVTATEEEVLWECNGPVGGAPSQSFRSEEASWDRVCCAHESFRSVNRNFVVWINQSAAFHCLVLLQLRFEDGACPQPSQSLSGRFLDPQHLQFNFCPLKCPFGLSPPETFQQLSLSLFSCVSPAVLCHWRVGSCADPVRCSGTAMVRVGNPGQLR